MATKLTKPLKREIHIHGIESPIIVTFDQDGIFMNIPGHQKKLFGYWQNIVGALQTPANCLSYLEARPLEFLKHQVASSKKK